MTHTLRERNKSPSYALVQVSTGAWELAGRPRVQETEEKRHRQADQPLKSVRVCCVRDTALRWPLPHWGF